MKKLIRFILNAVSMGLMLGLGTSFAQPVIDKQIQYIIPFPAAGESDIVARLQADISAKNLISP
jgi:tripartite-type tricarboxylate transporter receptor subunit TctC